MSLLRIGSILDYLAFLANPADGILCTILKSCSGFYQKISTQFYLASQIPFRPLGRICSLLKSGTSQLFDFPALWTIVKLAEFHPYPLLDKPTGGGEGNIVKGRGGRE